MVKIFDNIHPQIDLENLLRGVGGDKGFPQIREDAKWACNVVEKLARPKAIVGLYQFERSEPDAIRVIAADDSKSVKLEIGEQGLKLLCGAENVQISFVTLGHGVQQMADELQNKGEMLKQYLLDNASIFALHHAGRLVNQLAEKTARDKNWGVGRRLSPGDLRSWSLEGQAVLAELLPISQIGMEIRHGSLLYPLKSVSSLIGMGPGYTDNRVGTVCQWCLNQKTCPIYMSETSEVVPKNKGGLGFLNRIKP